MTTLSANPKEHATPIGTTAGATLAMAITRAASAQTYATIRLLADRDRAADAFRAYAYFRWLDDRIDDGAGHAAEKAALLARQRAILEAARHGVTPDDLGPEEALLAEMVAADPEPDSGLQTYLDNMMGVMAFDLVRRGRLILAVELDNYSRLLAAAVSEALLHFIGHGVASPRDESRHSAVLGAIIIHMLRDTIEDTAMGYHNIPAEYLHARGLAVNEFDHPAYREWARDRVALARRHFRDGRAFLGHVGHWRRRAAGYAYIARFEWMARLIERDGYLLRAAYPERKSARAAMWMLGRVVSG